MADQDRWTNDRNRARWASDDQNQRGYQDYGRRSESGRGQDEGRTFDTESDIYGAGYGGYDLDERDSYSGSTYGGGSTRGSGGRASWDQSSYGRNPREGYSQSSHARGAQGGYGGYGDQGSYGQGAGGQGSGGQGRSTQDRYGQGSSGQTSYGSQYGGAGYDQQRRQSAYERDAYGAGTGRYGGALGGNPSYGRDTPHYADQDWSPRNQDGEHRGWMERTGEKIANFFGADIHRGRGPKNYTRSDDRIREDVNDRLTDDPYLDASEIDVQVASGEVTLTGTVGTREEKRRAEDLADQVTGARHVQNSLRVQQRAYGSTGYGSTTGAASTTTTTGASATTDATAGKTGATRTN